MSFEDFEVLVDVKHYRGPVPAEQCAKLRADLARHPDIPFAWLVSLTSNVDAWDRAPLMFEWISSTQCVVYVNRLALRAHPDEWLRAAWFSCRELAKLLAPETDPCSEMAFLRDRHAAAVNLCRSLRKQVSELLHTTQRAAQAIDAQLVDALTAHTGALAQSHAAVLATWWASAVEHTESETDVLSTTELWAKFRVSALSTSATTNDDGANDDRPPITVAHFRRFVRAHVPAASLRARSKKPDGPVDVLRVRWRPSATALDHLQFV